MEEWILPYRDQLTALWHVLVALVLGGVIGLERESKDRPAGLRTNMLVAAVAALLTDLASSLVVEYSAQVESEINADPTRVIVAIATGISFIGAGTIFRSADNVSGLTTAATLLVASGVGIAVAMGQYILATGVTLIALLVLQLLAPVSNRLSHEATARDRDA